MNSYFNPHALMRVEVVGWVEWSKSTY